MEKETRIEKFIKMRFLIFILFALILSSCSHYRWIHKNRDEVCEILDCGEIDSTRTQIKFKTDTIREHEFIIEQQDSGLFDLYLDCDSNNQVILNKVDKLRSREDSIRYELKDEKLSVISYYTDTIESLKERIKIERTRSDTTYITKKVPEIVREDHVPIGFWVIGSVVLVLAFIFGIRIH